ncbi:MAG TPA: hypothetical protein VN947_07935 [Polyangia bacterium]|nr:hypothetical protein [Polyangia bacterium]
MKPTEESTDTHRDFGDEATNVMGGDLLSSLTERSRRIEVAPLTALEPEISIGDDEPEPVTTMRPVAEPLPPLVADGEYPALGDEESTVAMEEPEPTTVVVRPHADRPAPLARPVAPIVAAPPAPRVAPVAPIVAPPPAPLAAPLPTASAPDPQWASALSPRILETVRVPPLPAPELESMPERASQPAAGSRSLSLLAAVALGVAAWTLGLGHHEAQPKPAMSAPALAPSVIAAPSPLPPLSPPLSPARPVADPAHAKLRLALDRH